MKALNDFTYEKLCNEFEALGLKKYRAEQVFRWTATGANSFDEMTNVPKDVITAINLPLKTTRIKKRLQSTDGTRKFLIEFDDGELVESVLMEYKHGFSVCISTQVGCAMGCKFCASCQNGKKRNLSPAEMLGQITEIQKSEGVRISNIVLMGMGEPLDNYENVIDFLRIVNHHLGLNIGIRHISVSTCGLVDKIRALADENLGISLSISLHAAFDEKRNQIMPVNKKWSLEALIAACREYCAKTRRRISFEYVLINEFNDTHEDAKELARLLDGITEHVNLIPVNSTNNEKVITNNYGGFSQAKINFEPSTKERRLQFRDWLMKMGVNTTIRRTLGSDISASCGQLVGKESNFGKNI